ncbi:MAG TPA: hypothetical protein VF546_25650 [Pyrinomonadaceae bacterium]|jgi:hypothetical protein
MLTNRTKRQTRRATGAMTYWSSAALAGAQSAHCPSAFVPAIQLGVGLGNQPGLLAVGQISDQRQLHL